MTKLIALAVIAACAELPEGVPEGAEFEATPELAELMQTEGVARPVDAAPATSAPRARNVRARVLVDGGFGKVNDIVTVSAGVAKSSGELDAHPDAVEHAESLANR